MFIGEDKLTDSLDRRTADVESFFRTDGSDQERIDLLRRFGVDYVFYGPDERKVGAYDPFKASFLQPVHRSGDVTIFRVVGGERQENRVAFEQRAGGGRP